jgi:hypothetical protein
VEKVELPVRETLAEPFGLSERVKDVMLGDTVMLRLAVTLRDAFAV